MGLPFQTLDVCAEQVVARRGGRVDPERRAGDASFAWDGLRGVFEQGEEGEEFGEGFWELQEGAGRAGGCCGHGRGEVRY